MWQLNSNIIEYLPDWFRKIVDFQEICQTESEQFEILAQEINAIADNFFFQTMDEGAVSLWEQIFNIAPNPTVETLAFRQARLINRISLQPPYTLGFLYKKLDELIGVGKWSVTVDYPNYTLYIESSVENQQYATELAYTIGRIKPAHIVYINKPYIVTGITINESVELSKIIWNYKLSAWGLGLNPFASSETLEVVVVPAAQSIQQTFLNETAASVIEIVSSARVNGTIAISELTKSSSGNTATIQYSVTSEQTSAVTQLELLDSDGNVLTTSPVYVPITDTTIFTHNIPVEEATA
nr:MAG TPA: tail protein [Caudoviricetes sp.]